ncbi:hypothetical protein C9374_010759 [Naegleria lovaniensis]|uniref:Metallo-beta-lactamase domain-containing protein n=1 Tax=Naegleria lovaniensis TaxID=51637 RepID=A0AA88GB29_NAELO|nr:uncharacterized protein C9374_010759 [Naegleria lovaniensis]KAG2374475.1 hypothetical protein C9374_010759 [Naegleria lovaniensis]
MGQQQHGTNIHHRPHHASSTAGVGAQNTTTATGTSNNGSGSSMTNMMMMMNTTQASIWMDEEYERVPIGSCMDEKLKVQNPYVFKDVYIENLMPRKAKQEETPEAIPSHWVMKGSKLLEFKNPWDGFKQPSTSDVFKFQREMALNKQIIPSNDELPQIKPNINLLNSPDMQSIRGDGAQVTWIGHSTFLVQYRGVNILTDPVFSDRCSPVQFMGPNRIKPLPITIENLPTIHFVIISHNHYDHLDYYAITALQKHHDPIILLPFRMKYDWMEKFYSEKNHSALSKLKLIELDWWKSTSFNVSMSTDKDSSERVESNFTFTYFPAQHWSMRSGFDRNEALWGSWGVQCSFVNTSLSDASQTKSQSESIENTSTNVCNTLELTETVKMDTIDSCQSQTEEANMNSNDNIKTYKMWFAGDTGYSKDCFTEIGNRFGPVDLSFIPIGAYEPRWMMKSQHINPDEAVQIALDIKSKKQISMHWGTFILTTEPIMQPKKDLEESLKQRGLDSSFFVTMCHGDTMLATSNESTRSVDISTHETVVEPVILTETNAVIEEKIQQMPLN